MGILYGVRSRGRREWGSEVQERKTQAKAEAKAKTRPEENLICLRKTLIDAEQHEDMAEWDPICLRKTLIEATTLTRKEPR